MYSVADSAAGLALYSPSDHRNSKLHPRRVVSEQIHEPHEVGSSSGKGRWQYLGPADIFGHEAGVHSLRTAWCMSS